MTDTVTDTKIFALVSNQGTACPETALCSQHMTSDNKDLSVRVSQIGFGKTGPDAADIARGFVDCTGNENLACQACGITAC